MGQGGSRPGRFRVSQDGSRWVRTEKLYYFFNPFLMKKYVLLLIYILFSIGKVSKTPWGDGLSNSRPSDAKPWSPPKMLYSTCSPQKTDSNFFEQSDDPIKNSAKIKLTPIKIDDLGLFLPIFETFFVEFSMTPPKMKRKHGPPLKVQNYPLPP